MISHRTLNLIIGSVFSLALISSLCGCSKRRALAEADQSTSGRIGGAWTSFETKSFHSDRGLIAGTDEHLLASGLVAIVEDDIVRSVVFPETPDAIEAGHSYLLVKSRLEDYLPRDATLLEEKFRPWDLDPRYGSHISIYHSDSLALLYPDTDWNSAEPGTLLFNASQLGELHISPELIHSGVLEIPTTNGDGRLYTLWTDEAVMALE